MALPPSQSDVRPHSIVERAGLESTAPRWLESFTRATRATGRVAAGVGVCSGGGGPLVLCAARRAAIQASGGRSWSTPPPPPTGPGRLPPPPGESRASGRFGGREGAEPPG